MAVWWQKTKKLHNNCNIFLDFLNILNFVFSALRHSLGEKKLGETLGSPSGVWALGEPGRPVLFFLGAPTQLFPQKIILKINFIFYIL
jgi:hypothetical protein